MAARISFLFLAKVSNPRRTPFSILPFRSHRFASSSFSGAVHRVRNPPRPPPPSPSCPDGSFFWPNFWGDSFRHCRAKMSKLMESAGKYSPRNRATLKRLPAQALPFTQRLIPSRRLPTHVCYGRDDESEFVTRKYCTATPKNTCAADARTA